MTPSQDPWYPIAETPTVTKSLWATELLGRRLVLFRRDDGRPVVLEDRCPHRNIPLSQGQLEGQSIRCAYHGWRFDSTGACVEIPGLVDQRFPPSARVRTYSSLEADGLIWVSLGENATTQPLVSSSPVFTRDPCTFRWTFDIEAPLLDTIENFLDPAHTHFVHGGLVRSEGSRAPVQALIRSIPGGVEAKYTGEERQSGFISRALGANVGHSFGRFLWPSTAQLEYRNPDNGLLLLINVDLSPVNDSCTRSFVTVSGLSPRWVPRAVFVWLVKRLFWRTVQQDRVIVATRHTHHARLGQPPGIGTELDSLSVAIRRLVTHGLDGFTKSDQNLTMWL
jgi:phenylpropionate dioxygenase-like ring-hydroxylating dioxygenase large terminal subunit